MMELKPCPFCGGEAALYTSENGEHGMVFCEDCEVETPMYKGVDNAISAWNRRITDGAERKAD